jgi:hypothetical protein
MKSYALNAAESLVQDLQSDPSCPKREDKAQRFMQIMGACRQTYFNYRTRLEETGRLDPNETIASIPVRGKKPRHVSSCLAGSGL